MLRRGNLVVAGSKGRSDRDVSMDLINYRCIGHGVNGTHVHGMLLTTEACFWVQVIEPQLYSN